MPAMRRYGMCDDGTVTISVCKRRHRRSNWKTIATASLPLPDLLSAPFSGVSSHLCQRNSVLMCASGDLVLKKRDTDAGCAASAALCHLLH
jgi:hypothetical protein